MGAFGVVMATVAAREARHIHLTTEITAFNF